MKKEKSVKGRVVVTAFVLLMLGVMFAGAVPVAAATTWYVDDEGGADFAEIQDAANAASPGDTIIVYPGTYTENMNVNKDHLTIKSESGAEATIVQAADLNYYVFRVTADYVNISGFNVKGTAGEASTIGISLSKANHCSISNNTVLNNLYGIYLSDSSNNILTDNAVNSNKPRGIYLAYSSKNTLANNTISGNSYNFGVHGESRFDFIQSIDTSNKVDGKPIYYWVDEHDKQIPNDAGYIGVVSSTNITVKDVTLTKNYQGVLFVYTDNSRIENVTLLNNLYGIYLHYYSSDNTLTNNNASNNHHGIYLGYSSKNTLINNIASLNNLGGIHLSYSSGNILMNNNLSDNDQEGINLYHSDDNILENNVANSNDDWGISLGELSDNNTLTKNTVSNNVGGMYIASSHENNFVYLNNFINNIDNARCGKKPSSIWNSPEPTTYTYNGNTFTSYVGNYWDDYADIDTDNDGIWDNPYNGIILGTYYRDHDHYPLAERFENYGMGPPPTDTTPPDTEIISGPSGNINYDDVTFLWTGSDDVTPTSELVYSYYLQGCDIDWSDWMSDTSKTYNDLSYGDYIFNVKAKDQAGNVDTTPAETDFTISPNQPPIASFTYSPENPKAGEEVKLSASASYDLDGDIQFYEWDLNGDGIYDGITTEPEIYYFWDRSGAYLVTLKVTDEAYGNGTVVQEISVEQSSLWNRIRDFFFPSIEKLSKDEKKRFEMIKSELNIHNRPHSDDPFTDPYFYDVTDDQLLFVLNKKVEPELEDSLTYETAIYDTLHDMKYADMAARGWRGWENPAIENYFENMAEMNVWAESFDIALKGSLEAAIKAGGGSGIGVGVILKLPDIAQIWGGLTLLDEAFYKQALCDYFTLRKNDFPPDEAFKYCGVAPIHNNEGTEEYFESLWIEYGGSHIKERGGLKSDFKEDIIIQDRELLHSGVEKYRFEFESYHIYYIKSPGDIRVYDSEGRVTGSVNDELREEIPNSIYDDESKTIVIFPATDSYYCQVVGTDEGPYGLEVTSVENGEGTTFTATDIPTTTGATHEYSIDWAALSQGEAGVTVRVDSDGDGTFEYTFTADNELTQEEFLSGSDGEPIPEFTTIAIPVAIVLGLIFLISRRKRKG